MVKRPLEECGRGKACWKSKEETHGEASERLLTLSQVVLDIFSSVVHLRDPSNRFIQYSLKFLSWAVELFTVGIIGLS